MLFDVCLFVSLDVFLLLLFLCGWFARCFFCVVVSVVCAFVCLFVCFVIVYCLWSSRFWGLFDCLCVCVCSCVADMFDVLVVVCVLFA